MPVTAEQKQEDTKPKSILNGFVVLSLRRHGLWINKTISRTLDHVIVSFNKFNSALATEDIISRGRSIHDVSDGDYEECEKLAVERNKIEDIVPDKNKESLETRFRELTGLERIWDNLKTSERFDGFDVDNKPASKALIHIQNLPPRAQVKLKKFYTIKALVSLDNKIRGDYNFSLSNFNKVVYHETTLRKEYIKQQIKLLFTEAAETLCSSNDEFENFLDSVLDDIRRDVLNTPPIPDKAPELYKQRKKNPQSGRKENPVEFLERVYGEWLNGKGLYRSHIKAWDPSLYGSLYKIRKQIPNFENLLPTAQGRSVDDLARSDSELVEARRASNRRSIKKIRNNCNPTY